MSHSIYIIRCDDNDYIKVGMTINFKSRLSSYKTSHWSVNILRNYTIPITIDLRLLERNILSFMEIVCISRKGELFKFSRNLLSNILEQCDQHIN